MKKLLLLLMLVPLAFAAAPPWQATATLAVGVAVALLAVLYVVGTGFGINELQMMAKEEFFQLIAMALMLAVFVGTNSLIDGISTNALFTDCAKSGGCDNLSDAATYSLDQSIGAMRTKFESIASFDLATSAQASKASQCTVLEVGYSVSACGGYMLFSTPLSMAGGIAGFALGELYAMKKLIEISSTYSLTFLLAISMHIMLPAGVIFNDILGATFKSCPPDATGNIPATCTELTDLTGQYTTPTNNQVVECDPAALKPNIFSSVVTAVTTGGLGNIGTLINGNGEDKAVATYIGLRQNIRGYLYAILVQATLGPVISLLMFAASLRALTSLAGAEVDVSAISRFI
jgi:hypothetical protein